MKTSDREWQEANASWTGARLLYDDRSVLVETAAYEVLAVDHESLSRNGESQLSLILASRSDRTTKLE